MVEYKNVHSSSVRSPKLQLAAEQLLTGECSNYCTTALISHTSKVMLKILQASFMNQEIPHVQAGFRKYKGTRDQIANSHWIIEKAREFQKNIYFCFIEYAKAFDYVDQNKLWKIKRWEYQTTLPAS